MLDRQLNALNLLLQVFQCASNDEEEALLADEDSMTILRLSKEGTESLLALDDASIRHDNASLYSADTTGLSTRSDFDAMLLSSRVYRGPIEQNTRVMIHSKRHGTNTDQSPQPKITEDEVPGSDASSTASQALTIAPASGTRGLRGSTIYVQYHNWSVDTAALYEVPAFRGPELHVPFILYGPLTGPLTSPQIGHIMSKYSLTRLGIALGNHERVRKWVDSRLSAAEIAAMCPYSHDILAACRAQLAIMLNNRTSFRFSTSEEQPLEHEEALVLCHASAEDGGELWHNHSLRPTADAETHKTSLSDISTYVIEDVPINGTTHAYNVLISISPVEYSMGKVAFDEIQLHDWQTYVTTVIADEAIIIFFHLESLDVMFCDLPGRRKDELVVLANNYLRIAAEVSQRTGPVVIYFADQPPRPEDVAHQSRDFSVALPPADKEERRERSLVNGLIPVSELRQEGTASRSLPRLENDLPLRIHRDEPDTRLRSRSRSRQRKFHERRKRSLAPYQDN